MTIINQLFEAVYYGSDLEFNYNDSYYFINSGKVNDNNIDKHSIVVYKSKKSIYKGEGNGDCVEIYSSLEENYNDDTNNFFNARIFGGKSLYEIVNFITEINY